MQAKPSRVTMLLFVLLIVLQLWIAITVSQKLRDIANTRVQVRAEIAAEQRKFATCLSANAGLVDSLRQFDTVIKQQKRVIRDAIDIAKRCEAPASMQAMYWVEARHAP